MYSTNVFVIFIKILWRVYVKYHLEITWCDVKRMWFDRSNIFFSLFFVHLMSPYSRYRPLPGSDGLSVLSSPPGCRQTAPSACRFLRWISKLSPQTVVNKQTIGKKPFVVWMLLINILAIDDLRVYIEMFYVK